MVFIFKVRTLLWCNGLRFVRLILHHSPPGDYRCYKTLIEVTIRVRRTRHTRFSQPIYAWRVRRTLDVNRDK